VKYIVRKNQAMHRFLLATLVFMSFCGSAWAWGDEGHKIVCEIAFRLAQPDTRAVIRKLIRSDTEFDTFTDSSVYPDHPRKRAPEHFINFPRDASPLTSGRLPRGEQMRAHCYLE
jgi:hypothetical protein